MKNWSNNVLVTPSFLASRLQSASIPHVIPVDCSLFMPGSKRDACKEFQERRIPNARFFNLDKVKGVSPYPYMLPPRTHFEREMSRLGINRQDHIVVYDTTGIFSAPRLFWMLQYFGHQECSILDGGLPRWLKEEYDVECSPPQEFEATQYTVTSVNPELVSSYEDIISIVRQKKDVQIIDARPHDRFTGKANEPRPDISSGHIPGAISIPFNTLLNSSSDEFHSPDNLKILFKEKGVDLSKETVLSCGSGVTASVLFACLIIIGHNGPLSVYDGSWSEYADKARNDKDLIVKDV